MDNIMIEKNWTDSNILELKVSSQSEYVKINQLCYIECEDLKFIGESIIEFSINYKDSCYVEFGKKNGNFTPAFSLEFFIDDLAGKVKIEVDMEIDDNNDRKHRCCFYVYSDLSSLEEFGNRLILMSTQDTVKQSSLNL